MANHPEWNQRPHVFLKGQADVVMYVLGIRKHQELPLIHHCCEWEVKAPGSQSFRQQWHISLQKLHRSLTSPEQVSLPESVGLCAPNSSKEVQSLGRELKEA